MNPYRMAPPPGAWDSKLSPVMVRLAQGMRKKLRIKSQQLQDVHVKGLENLTQAHKEGCGVLITPNHSSHADPFTMYAAADEAGLPLQFMATWHVFSARSRIGQWMLQKHGVFSVDREGTDLRAFKMAVSVLQAAKSPLVIFPEGEIYHCNEKTTPFREGPATIALAAARRADRRIVCIPCAVKYRYLEDPTERLTRIMCQLERQIHWRPKHDKPLPDRIYAFGQAMVALKELEFLGEAQSGPLPPRITSLAARVLEPMEANHGAAADGSSVPERVKHLRRGILEKLNNAETTDEQRGQLNKDLDDIFLVVQLFSYPGDYVAAAPTIERLAETIDKFEEDVLNLPTASIKADREATVVFDEPIVVESIKSRTAGRELTAKIEGRVQEMLNGLS